MYCPKCGQQQTTGDVRFCSRCGFLLEGVSAVLASGGLAPRYVPAGNQPLSPRSKGVRQGAMLMLSTLFVVPMLAILIVGILHGPGEIVGLAAVFCFIGGLLRMLFALIMEDAYASPEINQPANYSAPGQFEPVARRPGLPAASVNTAPSWRPQPNTAELVHPPSVTENTTRLLDKDEPSTR